MNKNRNLAIMASAGTGKTYTLAMRYITLLLLGAEPGEIVAMTFTNKAAGEIFDKIIQILLEMLDDSKKLDSAMEQEMLPAGTTSRMLTEILRKILCQPDKLSISTFDSFFFNIISAFPLECGISGAISLLEKNSEDERTRFLIRLIRDSQPIQRVELLELLKIQGFSQEKYSLFNEAKSMVDKYYPEYLKYPKRELWDHGSFLAKEFSEDDILEPSRLLEISRNLREISSSCSEKKFADVIKKIAKFAESAVTFPNMSIELPSVLEERLCQMLSENMSCSELELRYNKNRFHLDGTLLDSCKKIVRHTVASNDYSIRKRVLALYDLLNRYDQVYSRFARCAGYLTFQDIPYLLKNDSSRGIFTNRLVMEERLDAKYNHYLLDEFQDTSDEQWDIMKNLVDEIFQPEQDRFRSFFYVGDIKQSIYQWRNGNPKLFDAIYDQYCKPDYADGQLQKTDLSKSFRSSTPVIDTVNQVFAHPERILNPDVKAAVGEMEFQKHTTAKTELPGCVMLIESPDFNSDSDLLSKKVFDLIVSLDPFSEKHNCTVGVLTLSNKAASKLAADFRDLMSLPGEKANFDISLEGSIMLDGSSAYSICRNLLLLAEHPSDPMARGYLSMVSAGENKRIIDFPFFCSDEKIEGSDEDRFKEIGHFIRKTISSDGFTGFLNRFLKVFKQFFSHTDSICMDHAINAAMKFDSSGNKNISDFLSFLDHSEFKSSSLRKSVQFMTVHKSKGLDFDIVILPELFPSKSMNNPSFAGKLIVAKNDSFQPLWISYPPKVELVSASPEKDKTLQTMKKSEIYEDCCLLYVAMTRARHALYMLIPPLQKDEIEPYRFANLLNNTLTEPNAPTREESLGNILYSAGDPQWVDKIAQVESKEKPLVVKSRNLFRHLAEQGLEGNMEFVLPERVVSKKPSDHQERSLMRVSKKSYDGAEFGTHLHELMSRIGYLNECDTEQLLAEYLVSSEVPEEMTEDFSSVFRNAVASPDAAALLSCPGEHAEFWREKKFSIRMNGKLINCVFDRVDVIRDPDGKVQKVRIVDYKSDNSDDPEYFRTNYGDQLTAYSEVLQRLFGIVPEKNIFILRSGKTLLLD